MPKRLLSGAVLCLACCCLTLAASDWPQWRGPQRTGISTETGLLQEWPPQGPRLVWRVSDVGYGFATPSVVGDRIYLLSNQGLQNESVRAFNVSDGTQVWSTRIGNVGNPNQVPNYPAARSTPTVDGDTLFAFGSDGDLAALETRTGRIRWQKNVRDFGGAPGNWAYAESPLVDGDRVVVTPGGRAPMMAFNKRSGAVLWTTPVSDYGEAAYSSITIAEVGGVRQYVAFLQSGLIGVEANTGVVLWRDNRPARGCQGAFPTPIFNDGYVYGSCNGAGGALLQLRLEQGKVTASPVYHEALPGEKGGAVLIQGHLYGTNAQALFCTEFLTGEVKWRERGIGVASVAFADGRLYLRGENGDVALVEPAPTGYREKGRFTPGGAPDRRNAGPAGWPPIGAWPHPVVANGRLYLRDLGTLWSYDIRRGN